MGGRRSWRVAADCDGLGYVVNQQYAEVSSNLTIITKIRCHVLSEFESHPSHQLANFDLDY